MKIKHNVFVGDTIVNDYPLTLEEADDLGLSYLEDGYDPDEIYITYQVID